MVMKQILFVIFLVLLQGCYFNERGVSNRYYDGCKEYYDAAGVYHKKCHENIMDYKDITDGAKKLNPFNK